MYRPENQFYPKNNNKDKSDTSEDNHSTTKNLNGLNSQNQIADDITSDSKTLDNNKQNVINNQDIWIDLSGHEINNPENQINN